MGRILEGGSISSAGGGSLSYPVGGPNPVTGSFGTGKARIFNTSGTFVVPDGITSVRARVWGAGGTNYPLATGGTSSFGTFCSATGGSPAGGAGSTIGGNGGTGIGGDINSNGGKGGNGASGSAGGGGGVGNIFGAGGDGNGISKASGGGGASPGGNGGNGVYGRGGRGGFSNSTVFFGAENGESFGITEPSFDAIGCGGGGGGCGNAGSAGNGSNGGGGGGAHVNGTRAGFGGFPGGGGGGGYTGNAEGAGGAGGGGFSMKVCSVTPGQSITVTVGMNGTSYGIADGAPGLVIVEW